MPALKEAKEAGFSHVVTLAGPVPIEDWFKSMGDKIILYFEVDSILGPWREPYYIEKEYAKDKGIDSAQLKARDKWPLI